MRLSTIQAIAIAISVYPFTGTVAKAQQPIPTILDQYEQLDKIEKDGKKEILLKRYADEMVQLLIENNGMIDIPDTSCIKKVVSTDKKIAAYYYIAHYKALPRQIELFITYPRESKQRALYFSEAIKPGPSVKAGAPKSIVKSTITEKNIGNETYYQMDFTEGSAVPIEPIADLSLKGWFEEMAFMDNDSTKLALNETIINRMQNIWDDPQYFEKPLECFNRISVLISHDKAVKVYTWNTAMSNAMHKYWGAVSVKRPSGQITTKPLIDKTDNIRIPERTSLTAKKWYGAVYYDIIETQFKDKKYYTLLGFKSNSEFTKIKLIDVLTVETNFDVKFNSAIINKNSNFVPRAIFEYSVQANMMLKYDSNHKMIVMDNLLPSSPIYKDVYMHYGPDFSYNGLKFEKGKWIYYPDIDLRNPKTK